MMGTLQIDFRPGQDALPRILAAVEGEGHGLRGLRLLPCFDSSRSSLRVDIGDWHDRSELEGLERRLCSLDETIEIIHSASSRKT